MKDSGVVQGGPYKGIPWAYPMVSRFPRWTSVLLVHSFGVPVRREIRNQFLFGGTQ